MIVKKVKQLVLICLSSVLLMIILSNSSLAVEQVTVQFKLESRYLDSLFPSNLLSEIEGEVELELMAKLSESFPFIKWGVEETDQVNGPYLKLRLLDIEGGLCQESPGIIFEWLGGRTKAQNLLKTLQQFELYGHCQPDIPTQEPERLKTEIVSFIIKMIDQDTVQAKLVLSLISRIPFSEELVTRNDEEVLLNVGGEDLAADRASEIIAEFTFNRALDEQVVGVISMSPHGTNGKSVPVLITKLSVPSISPNIDPSGVLWDENIKNVLERSSNMQIFMKKYIWVPSIDDTVEGTDVQREL